jgi:RNA polymerase sigma-B factor
MRTTVGTKQRPHDDTPDSAAAFERLAALPDGPERQALRDELVRAWLPMANRIALRYRGRGESVEDLGQVAALGLVKAVDRYDPERGNAFESYAIPTITGEIKRHFRDHMWVLHVPRRVQDLRNRVRAAVKELSQTAPGHSPTVAEIAAYARMSEDDVRPDSRPSTASPPSPWTPNCPGSDDGYALGDALGESDSGFDLVVDREAVKPCLAALPERERTILYLRFFRGMTQSRIAEQLGISQMHVSRLLSGCCAKVRDEALAEGEQSTTKAVTQPPVTGLPGPGG